MKKRNMFFVLLVNTAFICTGCGGDNRSNSMSEKLEDSWEGLKASAEKSSEDFTAKAQARVASLKEESQSFRVKSEGWAQNEKDAFRTRLKECEDSLASSEEELKQIENDRPKQTKEWKERFYNSLEALRGRFSKLKEDFKDKL